MKESGKVIYGPWVEKTRPTVLSLHDFLLLMREYLHIMSTAFEVIDDPSLLFNTIQRSNFFARMDLAQKIYCLQELVESFYSFLDTTTHLPISVISLRYPLLLTLDQLKEEISSILLLVNLCKITSQSISPEELRQYQCLRQKALSLQHNSEKVIHLTNVLIDQARFEDHRLIQSIGSID